MTLLGPYILQITWCIHSADDDISVRTYHPHSTGTGRCTMSMYQKLHQPPEYECADAESSRSQDGDILITKAGSRRGRNIIAFLGLTTFLLSLVTFGLWVKSLREGPQAGNHIYSPAQNAIRYKETIFTSGFPGDTTVYQGPPTPENQKAWKELYDFGISRIPMSDAARLVNKTLPIPGDPGYYVVEIDVFHQLHCLNALRRRLWAEELGQQQDDLLDMVHLDHCIDSIRQSLMCSSDISTITWEWSDEDQKAKAQARTIHECRDFDAIRGWARTHMAEHFDTETKEPDPLNV